MNFAEKLILWYYENRRDLPWRNTKDPYKIWLSEIILQQTRIEQGLSYYHHFIETYPTVFDLAAASEDQVLKSWQGLGYYSRARNLHAAAKHIVSDLGGQFPATYDGILRLKGVGRYTAAAIASFAYGLAYPVIDGNVYRLVSRVYGIVTPIGTDAAYKEFETLLNKLIDKDRPAEFNQAMMDFGSTYCKPTGCDCENCIFSSECVAFKNGKVDILPVKPDKVKVKTRYFYYLDIMWSEGGRDFACIHCREDKDIWKGLYEFPLVESEVPLSAEALHVKIAEKVGGEFDFRVSMSLTHKLTHRTIEATFVEVKIPHFSAKMEGLETPILRDELKKLPVSRLIDRYLTKK